MPNSVNEKVKRRYFSWLKGAKGYAEPTIVAIERAIATFEEYTDSRDFRTFCERQATGFKKWLEERKSTGKPISNTTKYHTLRHLKAFFSWLATQNGYKSKISLDAVSFLTLDRRTVRDILSPRPHRFPSLEQVKALVQSIHGNSDVDRRDRALISLLLLTGIRYQAACSLRLGCFDSDRLVVHQDPRKGVHTKGGKSITTWLLKFDDELVAEVVGWARFVAHERSFGPTDPLFPRTAVRQADDGYSFEACGIEPVCWSGGNSIREILKNRSAVAGLPYFQPHSYRHAACALALKMSRTPEQLKALSQNFGHDQVITTLRSYGTLDQDRVADVISGIDFRPDGDDDFDAEALEQFRALWRKARNSS